MNDLASSLVRRKLEDVYVRWDDCQKLMAQIREVVVQNTGSPPADDNDLFNVTSAVFDSVQELSEIFGFTPEVQSLAKSGVKLALQSVSRNKVLGVITRQIRSSQDKYVSSHSLVLAQVSCSISAAMDWPSGTTFKKLTFASMLHDISRKNQEIAKVQNLHDLEARAFEFNLQDIEAYENHPPDVDVLVVQHHERPDGSGFPRKLFAHQISPLSALFIVAHDLVSFLYDEGSHESLKDFVLRYKEQYKIGNFKKILANLPIN